MSIWDTFMEDSELLHMARGVIDNAYMPEWQWLRTIQNQLDLFTHWLFNIAMENSPFIDDVPLKPPFIDGIFHGYGYVK